MRWFTELRKRIRRRLWSNLSQVAVTDGFVDDVEENLLVKVMSHCGVDSSTHPYFGDDGLIDAEVVSEDHNNVMDRLKEGLPSSPSMNSNRETFILSGGST